MEDYTLVVMEVNQLKEIAEFFAWVVVGVGAAVFLAVYLYSRARGGNDKAEKEKDKIADETRALYKEQNEELKSKVQTLDTDLKKTREDVSFLKGQNNFAREIMTAALASYFASHPESVTDIKNRVS